MVVGLNLNNLKPRPPIPTGQTLEPAQELLAIEEVGRWLRSKQAANASEDDCPPPPPNHCLLFDTTKRFLAAHGSEGSKSKAPSDLHMEYEVSARQPALVESPLSPHAYRNPPTQIAYRYRGEHTRSTC